MFFFFQDINKYNLGMTLVNQKASADFTKDMIDPEQRVEEYIKYSVNLFSDVCRNSVKNSKYVDMETLKISKNSISFTLCSEKELSAPGKSLKLLSNYLLEASYFKNLTVNGKLFKTYTAVDVEDDKSGEIKTLNAAELISDAELVKALVDYLLEPQFPYTSEKHNKRNAVDKMKALALQSGLLKYDGKLKDGEYENT